MHNKSYCYEDFIVSPLNKSKTLHLEAETLPVVAVAILCFERSKRIAGFEGTQSYTTNKFRAYSEM